MRFALVLLILLPLAAAEDTKPIPKALPAPRISELDQAKLQRYDAEIRAAQARIMAQYQTQFERETKEFVEAQQALVAKICKDASLPPDCQINLQTREVAARPEAKPEAKLK